MMALNDGKWYKAIVCQSLSLVLRDGGVMLDEGDGRQLFTELLQHNHGLQSAFPIHPRTAGELVRILGEEQVEEKSTQVYVL